MIKKTKNSILKRWARGIFRVKKAWWRTLKIKSILKPGETSELYA